MQSGYVPVPVEIIRAADGFGVDLYAADPDQKRPVLFCSSEFGLDAKHARKLVDEQIRQLYVTEAAYEEIEDRILDVLGEVLDKDAAPPASQFSILQSAVARRIENSFKASKCDALVETSSRVGQQISSLMGRGDCVPRDVFDIARHDYLTFTHVTNVASYAMLLAEAIGITDDAERTELATGAILHDMGKRHIPKEVLNKPGALDKSERALIEQHPQLGYEELCERSDITHAQLMMVYQHHERPDGTGYPVGILGDEAHEWARLLAVVDVFDALTGRRPYRRPASLEETLEFEGSRSGTQFDEEMVRCWISIMHPKT